MMTPNRTQLCLQLAAAFLLVLGAQARTWTSADGTRTFEGELQSYDAASGEVTVTTSRGKRMTFNIIRADGTSECATRVDNWDFNWQFMYWREDPLVLEQGDRLQVTCVYDTSADSSPVGPGWGTENEMCLVGLFASAN